MPRKASFLICSLLLFSHAYGQQDTPTIKHMREDYKQFTDVLATYYPIGIEKMRTGLDFKKESQKIYKEIKHVHSWTQFGELIRRACALAQERHLALANGATVKSYISRMQALATLGNIQLQDTSTADFYVNAGNQLYGELKSGLRVKYMNGRYYNQRPFVNGKDTIRAGMEIKKVNGMMVDDFVRANKSFSGDLRWDSKQCKWFDAMLPLSMALLHEKERTLLIEDILLTVHRDQSLLLLKKEPYITPRPLVELIDSTLLYVQLPIMSDETFYIREIRQKYTPRVRKIVIDVRNNKGGMDRCWQNILRHIVSDTLILERKLLVLNNEHVENLLKQYHIDASVAPPPFLNEHDYRILDLSTRLVPAEESLRFDGHIYIIQNEETFSAASSLAAIARQEEKIISVGTAGQESGQGLTPLIFKLKHSGLVFRLPFTLDFTGINMPDDLLGQRLEIPLSESIDEYMERVWNHDYYSLDYIQKQDKMIQFIKK